MVRDGVHLTTVTPDTLPEFRATFSEVFASPDGGEAGLERARHIVEPERLVLARYGDQPVATAGSFSFDMAMPWGDPLPCAGVTMVSVRADHRRRGVLRQMMAAVLADAVDRGEPLAALWASEAAIYGRFGFGPAIPTGYFEVERAHARFLTAPDEEIDLVDAEEAATRLPAIYECSRRQRHGLLSRSDAWWRHRLLADPPDRRHGAGAQRIAVIGDRGYALHRLRGEWGQRGPDGKVEVSDLVATDPEAHAALWRFVIDTDLSARTVADRHAIDDPLPLLLDDPVRAYPGPAWALQVRLVDAPAVFAGRGYRTDGSVTLELHDPLLPHNDGRWRLTVQDGRGRLEATDAPPQLTFDAQMLAAVSLGGVRVTQLAAAERLGAHDPGAVATLERLLATDVAPWHGGMF